MLTSRNKKDANPVPMCGFPYRSAQSYIAKLIASGHKVALCDQVNNVLTSKGLVERKVIRVITPGMIIDDEFLDGKNNNFILGISYQKSIFGVAFLDISTGVFFMTELFHYNDVIDEIMRVSPSEILIPIFLKEKPIHIIIKNTFTNSCISFAKNSFFNYKVASKVLLDQFKKPSLECLGFDEINVGISTAGALISYVRQTQKQEIDHLKPIKNYSLNNFLIVDGQSCKNLELFSGIRSGSKEETLINVLDFTVTSMGGRLLELVTVSFN